MEDLQWDVTTSTGENITVNGTIQQVHHHMKRIDAGWVSDFDDDNKLTVAPSSRLTKRKWDKQGEYGPPWSSMWCGADPQYSRDVAKVGPILDGIEYLAGLGDKVKAGKQANPKAGPGPHKCGQVSCSHDSSILWCNEVSLSFFLSLSFH